MTELFSPAIHASRIWGLLKHYPFVDDASLSYFRKRLSEARLRELDEAGLDHIQLSLQGTDAEWPMRSGVTRAARERPA